MTLGIEIDYEEIATANSVLSTEALDTMKGQIQGLNNAVTALIAQDGGLYLQKTSPAIAAQWLSFYTALTNGVEQITSFTSQFGSISTNMQQFDTDTATSITNSAGS